MLNIPTFIDKKENKNNKDTKLNFSLFFTILNIPKGPTKSFIEKFKQNILQIEKIIIFIKNKKFVYV